MGQLGSALVADEALLAQQHVAGSLVQVMIREEGDQERVGNLAPGGSLGTQVGYRACSHPGTAIR